jgi:CBS-domain-containing membrane protein
MSPRSVSDPLVRETHVLSSGDAVADAVRRVLDAQLPALPVADPRGWYCGIFGEREFFTALFPGYLGELSHAGFVPKSVETALEKRAGCHHEPISQHMNTEHVAVETDFSDAQVAEIFLHHRVLIVPVIESRRVAGVITRSDFFRALAERFLTSG